MFLSIPWATLLIGTSLAIGALPAAAQQLDRTPTHTNVSYGPHERNVLDLYLADSDQPTPLVMFIHGGGFRGGSKERLSRRDLQGLLQAGISVAAINYRYAQQAPLPAAHYDCRRALQFLRFNGPKWNIDKSRIGACGSSAGAQLCMYLAFHDEMARHPGGGSPIEQESTRLQAVAVASGQTTMDLDWWLNNLPGYEKPHRDFYRTMGVDNKEDSIEIVRDISALSLITKDDPPIYMSYNMSPDDEMPSSNASSWKIHHVQFGITLKEKMDSLGVECHLVYPGGSKTYTNRVAYFKEKLKP